MEIFQYYWIGAPIVILLFFYNTIRVWCVCLCVHMRTHLYLCVLCEREMKTYKYYASDLKDISLF